MTTDPNATPNATVPAEESATPSTDATAHPSGDRNHALAIGARLRRVRHQQGMSLADVQNASEGQWKAVVVGAYERGDRTITVARLEELARFYDVPLADLLPDPSVTASQERGRVTIDLLRLESASATPGLSAIARFAGHVRRSRGDHNGRVLTLRTGDIETIALAIDTSAEDLRHQLETENALLRLDAAGEPRLDDVEAAGGTAGTAAASPGPAAGRAAVRTPTAATTTADEDPLEVTIDLSDRDDTRSRTGDRASDRSRSHR